MKTHLIRAVLVTSGALWGVHVVASAGYGSGGMVLIGSCLAGLLAAAVERQHPYLLAFATALAMVSGVIWATWDSNAWQISFNGWTDFILSDLFLLAVATSFALMFALPVARWRSQRNRKDQESP